MDARSDLHQDPMTGLWISARMYRALTGLFPEGLSAHTFSLKPGAVNPASPEEHGALVRTEALYMRHFSLVHERMAARAFRRCGLFLDGLGHALTGVWLLEREGVRFRGEEVGRGPVLPIRGCGNPTRR